MRTIIYKDLLIPQAEYDELLARYSKFLKDNAKVNPTFWTKPYDFSDYPTVLDTDGDDVMRPDFLQNIADDVTAKYGNYGADHIVTLIHEDNWKSGSTKTRRGIWGTNYSYKYNNYHLQYCRWDKDNITNSFGTLNHEQDHSYDALIQVELGIDVRPILGVTNYDKYTTHGGRPGDTINAYHEYIKYDENAGKLKVLSPYLIAAYRARETKHIEHVKGLQTTIIGLLERLVTLWRERLYQKNGVKN